MIGSQRGRKMGYHKSIFGRFQKQIRKIPSEAMDMIQKESVRRKKKGYPTTRTPEIPPIKAL